MSYCRWSSDGFACDVYVYEDVMGGFTCHVARSKIVNLHEAPEEPKMPSELPKTDWVAKLGKVDDSDDWIPEYMEKSKIRDEWMENHAVRENIGLEFDGKTFNTESATSMANELVMLKNMGYQVPQYAIDWLYEEGLENGEQAEL